MPPAVSKAQALPGRDGWLFLTNDTNDTMAQTTGRRALSATDVRGYQRLYELRTAWLAARGVPYYVVVVPNKESLYSEHLPEGTILSEDRPARQVERRLQETSSPVHFRYLLDDLLPLKERFQLFPKTSNHWNDLGAYLAYRSCMSWIVSDGTLRLKIVEPDEYSVAEVEGHVGDLGSKLAQPMASVDHQVRLTLAEARLLSDNVVHNRGRSRIWEHAARSAEGASRAVILHDSFYERMGPFFAESFSRLHAAHNTFLDFDLVESERPDVVIHQVAERMLVRLPADVGAPTTAETAAWKLAEGGWEPRQHRG